MTMAQDNIRNTNKNRKSEAQERVEQADNAGRFAGNDADARAARQRAEESIRRQSNTGREDRNEDTDQPDTPARRSTSQAQDLAGDAQNVKDGDTRLEGREAEEARKKATEGMRQGRDNKR
jgi:hypothetical protein